MCGCCKGYYETCDVCSEDINLIDKMRSEECFKCQLCDCGTICSKCTESNIIYCWSCILLDNILEERIEKLVKELEFHKRIYTKLKNKDYEEMATFLKNHMK